MPFVPAKATATTAETKFNDRLFIRTFRPLELLNPQIAYAIMAQMIPRKAGRTCVIRVRPGSNKMEICIQGLMIEGRQLLRAVFFFQNPFVFLVFMIVIIQLLNCQKLRGPINFSFRLLKAASSIPLLNKLIRIMKPGRYTKQLALLPIRMPLTAGMMMCQSWTCLSLTRQEQTKPTTTAVASAQIRLTMTLFSVYRVKLGKTIRESSSAMMNIAPIEASIFFKLSTTFQPLFSFYCFLIIYSLNIMLTRYPDTPPKICTFDRPPTSKHSNLFTIPDRKLKLTDSMSMRNINSQESNLPSNGIKEIKNTQPRLRDQMRVARLKEGLQSRKRDSMTGPRARQMTTAVA